MDAEKSIDSLKVEHRNIDREIQREYEKSSADDAHIAELKRRKLRLKDMIMQAGGSA
jgi:hypothetical protein